MFVPYLNTIFNNGMEFVENGCTWDNTVIQTYAGTTYLSLAANVNLFGYAWSLVLSGGGATLTYGDYVYSVAVWDCDGTNTMEKVSGGSHMPKNVCVSPFYGTNPPPVGVVTDDVAREAYWKCPCSDVCSGTCVWETTESIFGLVWTVRDGSSTCSSGCGCSEPLIAPDLTLYGPSTAGYVTDCVCGSTGERRWFLDDCELKVPCGYATAEERCDCCDPCCDDLPDQPLFITCGACTESTTVTPTVGGGNGLDGVDSPSGQTYGACATLCGKELCANWYCSSGQWKLDGYIDGDFCGTGDLTHECCPLSLGTTTLSGCSPSGCDVCVGPDCGVPTDCCPDDDIPTTLTASFGPNTETPGCDEGTAEGTSLSLVYDSANDWWDGSATTATGNLGFRIWCDAGTWMGEPRCNGSAANSPSPLTLVSCNPFEATATATFGASCGGCHDGATEITQTYLITITA